MESDERFMREALKEAHKAFDQDEVPIGAVLVSNGQIIARGHNMVERLTDATAHAEIITLTAAFNHLGSKYLPNATLYVTLEPCVMCAGSLFWSKIGRVVIGAKDEKNGFSQFQHANQKGILHPKTDVCFGILQSECLQLLTDFFKAKRK